MIIIDTETGGLDPQKDALASVALYHTVTNESLHLLIKPPEGLLLGSEAEKIHGLTREKLEAEGIPEPEACDQIEAWMRGEMRKGSKALIIDNMKHMDTGRAQGKKSTNEVFRELSLDIKGMRDRLGIPVIVLHHLNAEGNTAWSGDIENDADIVIKLENQSEQLDLECMPIDASCTKNRDGKTGKVALTFDKRAQRFIERGT
jgi:hypothetical protein